MRIKQLFAVVFYLTGVYVTFTITPEIKAVDANILIVSFCFMIGACFYAEDRVDEVLKDKNKIIEELMRFDSINRDKSEASQDHQDSCAQRQHTRKWECF